MLMEPKEIFGSYFSSDKKFVHVKSLKVSIPCLGEIFKLGKAAIEQESLSLFLTI